MILISSRLDDVSTSNVIDWLYYQAKDYLRFNGDGFDASFSYRDGLLYITSHYREQEVILNCIDSFWYRKCGLNIYQGTNVHTYDDTFPDKTEETYKYLSNHASKFALSEFKAYREFIFSHITQKAHTSIGSYKLRELNKIETLTLAKDIGLSVPKTFILSSKRELVEILEAYGNLIVKPLYEGVYDIGEEYAFVSYTSSISMEDLPNIPSCFPVALFQEQIEKQLEIRVIYIRETCYSIAMFTQAYEQSQIDGRKCPQEILRMTPYKLPLEIEQKIVIIMNQIGLSYGALDFILSKNNEIIFLEINPVGQFSAYGNACNYYLDKIISEQL